MIRTAAAYLRVSTQGQANEDRQGLTVQLGEIERYAQRHGFALSATYQDTVSGTRARRDQLDHLLDEAPRYDAIIISSVDRLARRARIAYGLIDELADTGLEIHITDMGVYDADQEGSALMFGFKSVMAESDHRRLVKKLFNAKVAKVAGTPSRAGKPANPLMAYGWRDDMIDPTEAHWIRWMYRRVTQVGTQVMARELAEQGVRTRLGTVFTPTKIRRLIVNPLYRGVYEFGRKRGAIMARCDVEAIVSDELWAAANTALSERRGSVETRNPARLSLFPLTGHIRCGECGRAMNGIHSGRRQYGYYACGHTLQTKYNRTGQDCTHKRLYRADALHAQLQASLTIMQDDEAALLECVSRPTLPPPDLTLPLADLTRREDRLEAAYSAGAYTPVEFAQRRRDLQKQREALLATPLPVAPALPELTALQTQLREARTMPLEHLADALGLKVTVSPDGTV
ncbi:recombinase family protein, partial [Deinococcus ruber]|uniref:recombinase family protein n=1 Tax=Deinococcus ruber TaxID=1848197 RepID=UPI001668A430